MKFRAAVIGCGRIGAGVGASAEKGEVSHLSAYHAHPAVTSLAFFDPSISAAQNAAQQTGGKAYGGLRELLQAEKPEIVSVCGPDATHEAVVRQLLDCASVRGILAEKPLALTMAPARELAERARDKGIVLAVNYSRRFSGLFQELQKRLQSGEWGELQQATGFYTKGIFHNGT
ncbi:Gfo/Idh/MocA family oxidoreductase, partial [bacterium]|nr:Gfo/Idh/MocA family oxidoreductase [bacterium]